MSEGMVRLKGVGFAYNGAPVLRDVSLDVPSGQITVLMGPSGCGKSTLLALAAGLLTPDTGSVRRAPGRLGMVFQDPALLPWRSAAGNVGFALIGLGLPAAERQARARAALAEAGLEAEHFGKYPRELSGGMRQRVAFARALAVSPEVLLCDEPFSALDTQLRAEMRRTLRAAQARTGMTVVFVTHDRAEALELADTLVVMSRGRIEQVGPPAEICAHPANAFVRALLESGARHDKAQTR